jgi:hypothetical protein
VRGALEFDLEAAVGQLQAGECRRAEGKGRSEEGVVADDPFHGAGAGLVRWVVGGDGGQQFVGAYGLSLRGNAAVEAAARMVEALPPSVEVQNLELNKGRLSSVLVVYEELRAQP